MLGLNRTLVLCALLVLSVPAFAQATVPDSEVYTLYRDSILMEARIHIATFDSSDGRDYNRENCRIARDLFQRQPEVSTNYWCEPGRYRDQ